MKKVINFGRIDFNHTGRKINACDITLELRERENNKLTLSISGNVWNLRHTDIICGGQCLDEMLPFFKNNKLFVTIYKLWKNYHINDMHAGTPEQENFIKEHEQEITQTLKEINATKKYDFQHISHYEATCEVLKKYNLYEVIHNGTPYKYGHGWLYEPIPEEDLTTIKNIILGVQQWKL